MKRKKVTARLLWVSSCAIMSFCPGAGIAQVTGNLPEDLSEATQTGGLQDIVVTARKRSENLQDVPIAVTAVTADTLATAGSYNVADLEKVSPGLQIYTVASAPLPFLRGIGSNQSAAGFESPIAIYLDGIYQGHKDGNNFDLANIERIEVLKGPQGTLFGRNATGGAINIVTKDPGSDLELEAEGGYGRFNEVRTRLYVAGPITDTLGASIAFTGRWDDGYLYNPALAKSANPAKNIVGMAKLVWKPSDSFTAQLSSSYYIHDDATFVSPHAVAGTIPKGSDPSGFNRDAALTSPTTPGALVPIGAPVPVTNYNRDLSVNDHDGIVKSEGYRATLALDYDMDTIRLVSLTGYIASTAYVLTNSDLSNSIFAYSGAGQPGTQWSQEFQIQSNSTGPLKWIGGLYYMYLKEGFGEPPKNTVIGSNVPVPIRPADLSPAFGGSGAGTVTGISSSVYTNAYAAFAEANYAISDVLRVTAGLRFSTETKSAHGRIYNYIALPGTADQNIPLFQTTLGSDGLVFGTRPLGTLDVAKKFSKLTWRLTVDYKVATDAMLYASYNRGFKSGTFNATTFFGATAGVPVQPEVIDAYEVGFKTELLDHRLRINGSAFYYDYNNIQLGLITSTGLTSVQNAAAAKIYGFDIDISAVPTDRLTLRAAFNYLNSEYKNYDNAQIFLPRTTSTCPAATANNISPAQAKAILAQPKFAGSCSYALQATGQDLIFAPKFTANLGADYDLPLGEARLRLSGSLYYNDGYDIVPGGFLAHVNAYESLSLSATYYGPDDRYFLRLWGDNLTDNRHPIYISPQSASFQQVTARPISYGATLGFKFGAR